MSSISVFFTLNHSSTTMANAQLHALEFVKNKFGRDNLVLGGYRYIVRSQRNSRIYWRCVVNMCPATINTHDQHLVKRGYQHNNTSNQPKIEIMKVMQTIKKRSRYKVSPIPNIYEEEAVKLRTPEGNDETRQTVEQLPTYYSCNTSLYQQRSLSRPALQ